jgi:dTDP-4-amino-4,6-dideoxygalactose transaminase
MAEMTVVVNNEETFELEQSSTTDSDTLRDSGISIPFDHAPIAFALPEILDDDVQAVAETLRSGWLTTGKVCEQFEADLAAYLGADHVVAVSSATTAEEICLAFLGQKRGQLRIGVPTWTFASTALAVHRTNHVPVLLDVDSDQLNLSADSLDAAIKHAGLDAVVGVHFAGTPMEASIRQLCQENGLVLVEDAAHAIGASDDRGLIRGSEPTLAACYSFYATKNLPIGEGGAIATHSEELASFARTFRLHGMSADAMDRYSTPGRHAYDILHPGIKANLPDPAAALGISQLKRFARNQLYRRQLIMRYRRNLMRIGEIRFAPAAVHEGSADHLAVIVVDSQARRDAIIKHLASCNIGSSVHFRPLHTLSWFRGRVSIGPSGVRNADSLDGRVMSLPLHIGMTVADIDAVSAQVALASLTFGQEDPVESAAGLVHVSSNEGHQPY